MNSSIQTAGTEFFDSIKEIPLTLTPASVALYTILGAVLPLVYTYTVSSLNREKRTKYGEPPVPPYWIPFVGHAIALIMGQEKMLQKYRKADGKPGQPRTIHVFGQKIYLITNPGSIITMWRKSKTISFGPLQSFTIRELFGGTETAVEALDVGIPGVDQTRLAGRPPWMKPVHEMYNYELGAGAEGTKQMTKVYMKELYKELEKHTSTTDFQEVDVFAWIKKLMFPASGRALYGYKLRIDDELTKNFWRWDGSFLQLCKMYPDFMIPGIRKTREKVLQVFVNWRNEVKDKRHDIAKDVVWEENFGARLVRDRLKLTEETLEDDDHYGHASVHLSLFWGLEANAIPAAGWAVAFALTKPGTMERLKDEVKKYIGAPVEGSSLPSFDVEGLLKLPFLNAVFQEAMRLGVSSLSPRIVLEDTEIDGYIYKKGGMVQGLSPVVQLEEEYWGPDVHEYNPTRWLPLPGEDEATSAKRIRDFNSKLRPFGGGLTLCPGRYFATQEILVTLAVFATAFDWDIRGAKAPEPNRAFFGAGGLPPKTKLMVKVKRVSF